MSVSTPHTPVSPCRIGWYSKGQTHLSSSFHLPDGIEGNARSGLGGPGFIGNQQGHLESECGFWATLVGPWLGHSSVHNPWSVPGCDAAYGDCAQKLLCQ